MIAHVMYFAWIRHGILPSTIYNLRDEEKIILAAFHTEYLENISKK